MTTDLESDLPAPGNGESAHHVRPSRHGGTVVRRRVGAICGCLLVVGLAAGCQADADTAAPSHDPHVILTKSTAPTTTTTLPGCGSPRDPFDPTGSPPPAGSPAIC